VQKLSSQELLEQEANINKFKQNYRDEGDLKTLLISLWKGKIIIAIATFVLTVFAFTYSILAKEKWVAIAKITEAQLSSFSSLQSETGRFQPLFSFESGEGNKLDAAILPKVLINVFIQEFNRGENKREYFYGTGFSMLKEMQLIQDYVGDQKEALYNEWGGGLSISILKKKEVDYTSNSIDESPKEYRVSAEFDSSSGSYEVLKGYIGFVIKKSQNVILSNLNAILESKENELRQESIILNTQAKKSLDVEVQRAYYELSIAKEVGQSAVAKSHKLENNFLDYGLGVNVIQAKIDALESIDSLSVFEPELNVNEAKLNFIENNSIDQNIKFNVVQLLELPQKPRNLLSPNRKLMITLGGVFGFGLGGVIVLLLSVFRNDETSCC